MKENSIGKVQFSSLTVLQLLATFSTEAAVSKYPECNITDLAFLTNEICDEGTTQNSEECGWDGGDCILDRYPDCHVSYPSKVGNGKCDQEYYTKVCGWDGGDCFRSIKNKTDTNVRSSVETAGIVFGAMAVVALILLSQLIFVRSRNRYANVVAVEATHTRPSGNTSASGVFFQTIPGPLFVHNALHPVRTNEAKREQRVAHVMKNIIQRKVLSKNIVRGQDDQVHSFPYGKEICFHSSQQHDGKGIILLDSSTHLSTTNEEYNVSNEIDEEARGNFVMKEDIYIDSSSINSSRHIMTDNSLNSIRKNSSMASSGQGKQSLSVYSPLSCPVCCEDYKNGDDIAWSMNENCPHAFHVKCILEWLLENDDCPMCRAKYLNNAQFPVSIPVAATDEYT